LCIASDDVGTDEAFCSFFPLFFFHGSKRMDIFPEILMRSVLLFLWMGSFAGALVGVGMLLLPTRTIRLNQYFCRWVDTTDLGAEFDRPRWVERFFYRYHRWTGATLGLGGAFVLYMFLLVHVMRRVSVFLKNDIFGLLDAFSAIIVIGSVLAIFIGFVMYARPSLLRELEVAANQWISTDGLTNAFNSMHLSFDGYVVRYRKMAGAFLLSGGVYACIVLGHLLLYGDWKLLVSS
jgi:hypothetical protein